MYDAICTAGAIVSFGYIGLVLGGIGIYGLINIIRRHNHSEAAALAFINRNIKE